MIVKFFNMANDVSEIKHYLKKWLNPLLNLKTKNLCKTPKNSSNLSLHGNPISHSYSY